MDYLDGRAELVRKHPRRFPAFVTSLPMNDPAGLLEEAKRAMRDLGAVGVQVFTNMLGKRTSDVDYEQLLRKLNKRPLDYFRMFYVDTALFGAWEATKCGLKFFGPERVLFALDAPFDPEKGSMYIRTTLEIIDRLNLSPAERHAIYEGNARRLMKLA